MSEYGFLILLIIFISLTGTMIGAMIGIIVRNPSGKFLSVVMGLAGGIMLSIVILDLIPEALSKLNLFYFILYFSIGIILVVIINNFIIVKNNFIDNYKRVAILVILALGIHNFPEGLIMGCGIGVGSALGFRMSIIIALHDIPEGIAAAAPLMAAGEKKYKIIFYSFLSAVPALAGGLTGLYLGIVSKEVLGILFAFVSGIMSYIVCGEMIPEACKLKDVRSCFKGVLLGSVLGFIITKVL
ncbi:ZIP family metal transporter [Haloimpatiens lingqiaonensis]|uniref:ZIP family metal transporter n=1 Tax=Haloimpatiens lingqiaonensis TaxID=1380675 RepID=UPI0010FDD28E|nr:ZIP family metal transporter [Haloimpatiens lingqiaonensis]